MSQDEVVPQAKPDCRHVAFKEIRIDTIDLHRCRARAIYADLLHVTDHDFARIDEDDLAPLGTAAKVVWNVVRLKERDTVDGPTRRPPVSPTLLTAQ